MRKQKGLSLIAMIIVGVFLALALLVGAKVLPAVTEYYSIKQSVLAIVKDPALKGGTVSDLRKAYEKRAETQSITSVTASDLDIAKDGGELVIGFAYSPKIPLFANVSLVLDFQGSYTPND
ncbi:MAG: DUF4845 domain-containing protein [Rhodocyclaceae bacterium]|nr:DUF4845 domain-containing protein [Rhodocyclaceae bacterium]